MATPEDAPDDSKKIRVRITHVISPASFYLQMETSCVELNKMMRKLQARLEEMLNDLVEGLSIDEFLSCTFEIGICVFS